MGEGRAPASGTDIPTQILFTRPDGAQAIRDSGRRREGGDPARRVRKVRSGETSPRRPTKEKEHEVQGYFFDYEMYRQRREEYRREARTLRQAGVVGAERRKGYGW